MISTEGRLGPTATLKNPMGPKPCFWQIGISRFSSHFEHSRRLAAVLHMNVEEFKVGGAHRFVSIWNHRERGFPGTRQSHRRCGYIPYQECSPVHHFTIQDLKVGSQRIRCPDSREMSSLTLPPERAAAACAAPPGICSCSAPLTLRRIISTAGVHLCIPSPDLDFNLAEGSIKLGVGGRIPQ